MDSINIGDNVRIKGERKRGEVASLGVTPRGVKFAVVYIKEAQHCIPLTRLEVVRKYTK